MFDPLVYRKRKNNSKAIKMDPKQIRYRTKYDEIRRREITEGK